MRIDLCVCLKNILVKTKDSGTRNLIFTGYQATIRLEYLKAARWPGETVPAYLFARQMRGGKILAGSTDLIVRIG